MPLSENGRNSVLELILTEDCGFHIKVIHDDHDFVNEENVEVLDDKVYMVLMVKEDISHDLAVYFRHSKQMVMFNEFCTCDKIDKKSLMPLSSMDFVELVCYSNRRLSAQIVLYCTATDRRTR